MRLLAIFLMIVAPCYSYINVENGNVLYTIALKQRNMNILKDILLDISNFTSPNYGDYWNKDEINEFIKPSAIDVILVKNWLDKHKSTYVSYTDALYCKTPIKDVEEMFHIKKGLFQLFLI